MEPKYHTPGLGWRKLTFKAEKLFIPAKRLLTNSLASTVEAAALFLKEEMLFRFISNFLPFVCTTGVR